MATLHPLVSVYTLYWPGGLAIPMNPVVMRKWDRKRAGALRVWRPNPACREVSYTIAACRSAPLSVAECRRSLGQILGHLRKFTNVHRRWGQKWGQAGAIASAHFPWISGRTLAHFWPCLAAIHCGSR